MENFIKKVGELGTCYVTTGLISNARFEIDNVEVTDTELVLSNLDDAEIRIPLDSLPELSEDEETEIWRGEGIQFDFD